MNKIKLFAGAALIGLGGIISGCASTPSHVGSSASAPCETEPATQPTACSVQPLSNPCCAPSTVVKITAIGYGASSSYEGYSPGQKRLMAMRTSNLDAYRSLAEQIQGVRVNGNSTVSAMMAQVDSFRVFVDAYIRGAQVVTVTPMNDGNYETIMEVTLDSRFFDSFSQQVRNVRTPAVVGQNIRGAVGPGYIYGNNFYYAE